MAKGVDLVGMLLSAKNSKADMGALLDAIWDRFGGAKGLSDEAYVQYDAAKNGSSAKLNMLSTIFHEVGVMQARSAKEASAQPQIDNPEELMAVVQHAMKVLGEPNLSPEIRSAPEPGGAEHTPPGLGEGDNPQERPRDELAP